MTLDATLEQHSGVRRVISDILFFVACAAVAGEVIALFQGYGMVFIVAAISIAVIGETVAYVRDKLHKPTQDQLIAITCHNAQAVLASATYGTDIVLDPDQNAAVPGPHDKRWPYHAVKRGFDVAFSSVVVALGAIPTGLICVAISIDTPGNPIFLNNRVGRYGIPLRVIKLRTMTSDADNLKKYLTLDQLKQWHAEHKVDNDPRVTLIGRFLRKTSLDEAPQFLNVLFGQIPLRILKTRPEFSEKSMGAFALPAKLSTNKEKSFSQVASCFASGPRMRRISESNCKRVGSMEGQFLAKLVFRVVRA